MVRKTYTRQTSKHDVYQHRSSMYIHRSVHGMHAKPHTIKNPSKTVEAIAITPKNIPKTEDEQYTLPPKQPTPSVILRTDLMAKQRQRVSL